MPIMPTAAPLPLDEHGNPLATAVVSCPRCAATAVVPDSWIGYALTCPRCGTRYRLEEAGD